METLYRVGCCCLAFAMAMVLTGSSGEAELLRRSLRARAMTARMAGLLRMIGSWRPLRYVGERAGMRMLMATWGRVVGNRLGVSLGSEGGMGLALVLVVFSAVAGGVIASSPLGLVAGGVCACVAIVLRAESLRRSREQALAREMPAAFRSLASSLSAGRTLAQALAGLGEQDGGVVSEAFARAALRLSCGFSAQEALDRLSEELDAPGTSLLTCALSVSHRTGSPLKGLFERSATLLERRAELERTLSVKTAQVRLSVRVVCLLPAVMLVVLMLISPDYRAGLATTVGTASIMVAIVLDVVAVLVIRRLMRGVL